MSQKRHTAEEIVAKLRQLDVLTAQGRMVAEAIWQFRASDWKSDPMILAPQAP